MITSSRTFDYGQNNWPQELHIMVGDTVRISGRTDQNGAETSLYVLGGVGAVSTDREWTFKWKAPADREFYVLSLCRKVGVRPEEKLIAMKVFVHPQPLVRAKVLDEIDLLSRECEIQTEFNQPIRSVEFELNNRVLGSAMLSEGKVRLELAGVIPGEYILSGRANLENRLGSLSLEPQKIVVPASLRVVIKPPAKEINLTTEVILTEIEVQLDTLRPLPKTAAVLVLVNDKPYPVQLDSLHIALPVDQMGEGDYRVQAIISIGDRKQPYEPVLFRVKRDIPIEVRRVVSLIRSISLDICAPYFLVSAETTTPKKMHDIATSVLGTVEDASNRLIALRIPSYLPEGALAAVNEILGKRRTALARYTRFMKGEVEFWEKISSYQDITKVHLLSIMNAINMPVSKFDKTIKEFGIVIETDKQLLAQLEQKYK